MGCNIVLEGVNPRGGNEPFFPDQLRQSGGVQGVGRDGLAGLGQLHGGGIPKGPGAVLQVRGNAVVPLRVHGVQEGGDRIQGGHALLGDGHGMEGGAGRGLRLAGAFRRQAFRLGRGGLLRPVGQISHRFCHTIAHKHQGGQEQEKQERFPDPGPAVFFAGIAVAVVLDFPLLCHGEPP